MNYILSNMFVEATAKFRGENSARKIQKILADALYGDKSQVKEIFERRSEKLIEYALKHADDEDPSVVTRSALYMFIGEEREKNPELFDSNPASVLGNFDVFTEALCSVLKVAGKEAGEELSQDFAKALYNVRQLQGSRDEALECAAMALRIIELQCEKDAL